MENPANTLSDNWERYVWFGNDVTGDPDDPDAVDWETYEPSCAVRPWPCHPGLHQIGVRVKVDPDDHLAHPDGGRVVSFKLDVPPGWTIAGTSEHASDRPPKLLDFSITSGASRGDGPDGWNHTASVSLTGINSKLIVALAKTKEILAAVQYATIVDIGPGGIAGKPVSRAGRPALGDGFYARVAAIAVVLRHAGVPSVVRSMLAPEIAEYVGRPARTEKTVGRWFSGARARGFLQPHMGGGGGAFVSGPRLCPEKIGEATRYLGDRGQA